MRNPQDLRALATPSGGAPFDFAEFERRRAQVRHRARTAGWSAAAAIGMLAVVPVVAVLTQPEPAATVTGPPAAAMTPVADVFLQPPALVDMDRFALTSELEDHIALLDAEISAARLTPVPDAELERLETTRARLNDSLQRVTYAHALLDL
ncbi:MAG: hypothetical protein M3Y79_03810 [Pseudomonadota bacterium]|jgi:hypothetical protein|nr:hypothetical protein [Pseudomonadota bacterium]